ncbi:MAG: alanine racemase [Turicibacter sp.]|nr:alanine racemase [Turicibacter sp.]
MLAWARIDLENIRHNIREIQGFVGDKIDILTVVKADAYGHGAVEISRALQECGVKNFGVATCDEALELRNGGIGGNILILAHSLSERFYEIVEHDIMQTVSALKAAVELSSIGAKLQKTVGIHIKIDTGMGRIGFYPDDDAIKAIMEISRLPNVKIRGIFSHLAMAESFDKSFSNEQFAKYTNIVSKLQNAGLTDFKSHICNSGGILNNTEMHLDMVRPGLILYGIYPSKEVPTPLKLKPAMNLTARICHINHIKTGESAGYDRTFFAKRDTQIAVINLGYADGYPSALSNKSHVIINGSYAPIIGQVCMDQTMIDVTDIAAKEGDEVILFGKQDNLEIKAEDVAALSESKSREILCMSNIGKRVAKIYV